MCVSLISHMITQVWTLSEKEGFHQLTGAARKQKRKVEFCPAAICPQFMKCTANLFMKFLYDMSMKCSKAKTTVGPSLCRHQCLASLFMQYTLEGYILLPWASRWCNWQRFCGQCNRQCLMSWWLSLVVLACY